MPQTASIDLKVKADKTEVTDKAEFEVELSAKAEKTVRVNGKGKIKINAGEVEDVDFVMIKSDAYQPDFPKGTCNKTYKPIQVMFEGKEWFDLKRATFISGPATSVLLPQTVKTLHVDNRLPRDITVTVFYGTRVEEEAAGNGSGNGAGQDTSGQSQVRPTE